MIQFHTEEDFYMNKHSYRGIPMDIFYWQSLKTGWWPEDSIPSMPGFYAISGFCSEGVWLELGATVYMMYIGQTSNLKQRYHSHEFFKKELHRNCDCDVVRFSFLPVLNYDKPFMLDVEKMLIKTYRPLENIIHNNG